MSSNEQQPGITFTFTEEETGKQISVDFPLDIFIRVYRVINHKDIDPLDVFVIAQLGARVAGGKPLTNEQLTKLELVFRGMLKESLRNTEVWTSDEDILLSLSEHFIRSRQATYAQMAKAVSKVLGKPISPDAWRLRLTRWVEEQGHPPLEVKRGRPLRKKTDT